ncbi:MAG: hypothetical protein LBH92_06555 [Bacteroidales bacterium]|jgi:lipopolysaccharide export system protein LptA|nr:hypothetical protein [Bacteroidales bacterium]
MNKNTKLLIIILLPAFLILFFTLSGQEDRKKTVRIEILNADSAHDIASLNRTNMYGNVIFKHDSAILYCDSAYHYKVANSIDAFSSVHIKFNDSLDLHSNFLTYSGNSRIVKATGDVVLEDGEKTLYTDLLYYYRDLGYADYKKWGRIVDDENTLISKNGIYYTQTKKVHFQDSVHVFNMENDLYSDTLVYHTDTKVAEIFGPTHIYGKSGRYMYCEAGWYNTITDDSDLQQNIYAIDENQITKCQRATYDSPSGIGKFYTDVELIDTSKNIVVSGQYGEYHRNDFFGFMVDSALAILIDDRQDSMFLHSDTLFVLTDSSNSVTHLFSYYKVKIFKSNIQGACDSLAFTVADSILRMYFDPIMWEGESQLTSDSAYFYMKENNIDSIRYYGNAFVLSRDTLETYNQVRGRLITAYFIDNDIYKIVSDGNAESLYYIREENNDLVGIDKAVAARLYIMLENNEFNSITYIEGANAITYPEDEFPKEAQRLKGFKLQNERRPLQKNDIFKRE